MTDQSIHESAAAHALVKEISARMRMLLGRAEACIGQLDDSQVWFRAHHRDNAIGNLVLHIVGNLRQWILGGIEDVPDTRDRAAEFSATRGHSRDQLAGMLRETVEECCKVIDGLPTMKVVEPRRIQNADTTIAYALIMAVSHLGVHVGQIQFIGKTLLQEGYREAWVPPTP